MSRILYVSDLHLFHSNIIAFCSRPFDSVEHMTNSLVARWNKKVNADDEVYMLGDISWGNLIETKKILDKLNGKIFFVKGNHDSKLTSHYNMMDIREIKDNGKNIVLCHFPICSWNRKIHGSIHLFGHVHNSIDANRSCSGIGAAYNACVEVNNYEPCTLDEIIANNEKWRKENL